MGRQLEIGTIVPEKRDSLGNFWYIDENSVYLKLAKESKARFIGFKLDNKITIFRDRKKHVLNVNNSYGFNIEIFKSLNIEQIVLFEDKKIFNFTLHFLEQAGEYLHFKETGFEKQIFLHLNILDACEIDYDFDPTFSTRFKRLGKEWFHITKREFERPYMIRLGRFLAERRVVANVMPEGDEMFKAFQMVPYSDVKVVIVGQDPYHQEGVADGLAFSSKIETFIPQTLSKIYDTIEKETGKVNLERNPSLNAWAKQGVLLLNRSLTVEKGNPNSHSEIGWKKFTDFVFNRLREHSENLVFLLWGTSARNIKPIVDDGRHLVLTSEHPAFAAKDARDWENNNCFIKTNSFLRSLNKTEINW